VRAVSAVVQWQGLCDCLVVQAGLGEAADLYSRTYPLAARRSPVVPVVEEIWDSNIVVAAEEACSRVAEGIGTHLDSFEARED